MAKSRIPFNATFYSAHEPIMLFVSEILFLKKIRMYVIYIKQPTTDTIKKLFFFSLLKCSFIIQSPKAYEAGCLYHLRFAHRTKYGFSQSVFSWAIRKRYILQRVRLASFHLFPPPFILEAVGNTGMEHGSPGLPLLSCVTMGKLAFLSFGFLI